MTTKRGKERKVDWATEILTPSYAPGEVTFPLFFPQSPAIQACVWLLLPMENVRKQREMNK